MVGRFRHIIIVVLVWFVIFGVCVLLIGGAIVGIVDSMSQRIMLESVRNRYSDIEMELDRTNQLQELVSENLCSMERVDGSTCEVLARSVFGLDKKLSAFWIKTGDDVLRFDKDSLGGVTSCVDHRAELYCGGIHVRDYAVFQSFVVEVDGFNVGFDIDVNDLYVYMSEKPNKVNGYVVIINSDNQVLSHPDSLKLATSVGGTSDEQFVTQTLETGESPTRKLDSQHLLIPVFRQYFEHKVLDDKVVVMISVPYIVVSDELEMFSKYSFVIILVSLVLFLLLLVVFRVLLLREFRLRSKAEQHAASLQLEMVVNTMDQHFLFNCFNSLYALIGKDKEQSRKFVLSLSRVYRNVLEKDKKPMSTLAKELQFMQEYYFLQKIRFGNKIELICNEDGRYDNLCVPSMSVQLLVENAIKHNLIISENPLVIKIYFLDDKLVVENNVIRAADANVESFGIGLERIKSIYEQYTTTQIEISETNKKFCCILPLVENAQIREN